MSLKDDIILAQQIAMKAGEKEKVSILRMAISAIKNTEIEKQTKLKDEEVQDVIRRQVKQLQDALIDFERGGREDLIAQTKFEIGLLSAYLPAPLSDADLKNKIESIVLGLNSKEELNIGQVMGLAMKELKGQADGGRVREMVATILSIKK